MTFFPLQALRDDVPAPKERLDNIFAATWRAIARLQDLPAHDLRAHGLTVHDLPPSHTLSRPPTVSSHPTSLPQASLKQAPLKQIKAGRGVMEQGVMEQGATGSRATEQAVIQARAGWDRDAITRRWHDPALHRQGRPQGSRSSQAFDILEQARLEARAGHWFYGVAANLAQDRRAKIDSQNDKSSTESWDFVSDFTLGANVLLCGETLTAAQRRSCHWAMALLEHGQDLPLAIDHQVMFARVALRVIARMKIEPPAQDDPEQEPNPEQESQEWQAKPDKEPDKGQNKGDDPSPAPQRRDASRDPQGDGAEREDTPEQAGARQDTANVIRFDAALSRESTSIPPYRAYSTGFDRCVHAAALCSESETQRLYQVFREKVEQHQDLVRSLSRRWHRLLLARSVRSWSFDQEEGMLDVSKLDRVITDPCSSLVWKKEKDDPLRDTVVSLLIDNSGSMRGMPITTAALCVDILARTWERCGIRVEILGFTTRHWKGGESRLAWVEAGRPPCPGRLNDLLHIVYKSASTPYRNSRRHIAVMLREGLLKENIDGEALLWARRRLLERSEKRRILAVISDGAPVDDSTLCANPSHILERHLRSAIDMCERTAGLELIAFGIGHDVGRYYRRAVTIEDSEKLGEVLWEKLGDLFRDPSQRERKRLRMRGLR